MKHRMLFHFSVNIKIMNIGSNVVQSGLLKILRILNTSHLWTQQLVHSLLILAFKDGSGLWQFLSQKWVLLQRSSLLSWTNISLNSNQLYKNWLVQSLNQHNQSILKSKETSVRPLLTSIMNSTFAILLIFSKVY